MPNAAIGMRQGTIRGGWYIRGGSFIVERWANIPTIGFIEVIYDPTLAVGEDISNCDLISVRVVIESGQTAKYVIREQSQNWKEGSATGTYDIFGAGGLVPKIEDLIGFNFGGDE